MLNIVEKSREYHKIEFRIYCTCEAGTGRLLKIKQQISTLSILHFFYLGSILCLITKCYSLSFLKLSVIIYRVTSKRASESF